jgi:riboflavin synthase
MFNGIISHTGKVKKIQKSNNNCIIEISSKMNFTKKEIGDSISCSGTCLTLEKFNNNLARFYLSKETLKRTNFKFTKKGDIINLEKSLKYGKRLSGHFVQAHVDLTCDVKQINIVGKSWLIKFKLPPQYIKYIVKKGSITLNGVSLTIATIYKNTFTISIIPHTLKLTNLIFLKKGDFVNVEFDILGKYIRNFIK